MNTKKLFYLLLLGIVIVYCWAFRFYYTKPFDVVYMNDLYDHSQWRVPDSVRNIGDDGNYEIAGYRLVNGGKLYDVAPEVPPLGKYLIGYSIKLFNTSSLYAIPFVIFSVLVFYLLTAYFFTDQTKRYLLTILFALSPQIVANSYRATLDLPQMCFLLVHLLFLFKSIHAPTRKSGLSYALIAGISAGCFISVKIGIFIIPVLIADSYLLYKYKKLYFMVPILLLIPVTYAISTAQFFIQGGSVSEWIGNQKWIINFYRNSNVGFIPGMVFLTLGTSLYRGWWNSGWGSSTEWSILMPVGLVVLFYAIYKKYKARFKFDITAQFLIVYSVGILIVLSVITFWPRYLVILMPILLLLIGKCIPDSKYTKPAVLVIFIIVSIQTINILFPQPAEFLNNYKLNMQNGTYQEVHGMLEAKSQIGTNRELFWRELLDVDKDLQLTGKQVSVTNPLVWPWQNTTTAQSTISYQTPLGSFVHQKEITLHRTANRWQLQWEWDVVLPHFEPNATIEANISTDPNAKIFPYIYIRADKITDENNLVHDVGEITNLKRYIVIKKYLENSPADWDSPIGFVKDNYDPKDLEKIAANPAITIKKRPKPTEKYQPTGVMALQKKDGRRFILIYNDQITKE